MRVGHVVAGEIAYSTGKSTSSGSSMSVSTTSGHWAGPDQTASHRLHRKLSSLNTYRSGSLVPITAYDMPTIIVNVVGDVQPRNLTFMLLQ
jgi:hypothetical protein